MCNFVDILLPVAVPFFRCQNSSLPSSLPGKNKTKGPSGGVAADAIFHKNASVR